MIVTDAVERLARALVDKTDEEMGAPWRWGDYTDEGLRFALLMTHHELRDLAVRLGAERPVRTQAQAILAQYHQAYRDMTGVLAPVLDDDLDRVPAPNEWCLREVLVHMFRAEHGFLARLRFAIELSFPDEWNDALEQRFLAYRSARYDAREDALAGGIGSVRERWSQLHSRVLIELDSVSDDQLERRTWFWEDTAMPIRFRLHRFEEHLRQHTVQLEKTLVGIGRAPTEAHRLIRNVYVALADVETERSPAPGLREKLAATLVARAAEIRRA